MTVGIVQLVQRSNEDKQEVTVAIEKEDYQNCDYPGCYDCESCDTDCDCICYSLCDD